MKVGFVGAGKMAEAIIAALIKTEQATPPEISASDVDEKRRAELKRLYGINTYSKNALVLSASATVFLAVKPQNMADVLGELGSAVTGNHLVISIAAGKRLAMIESFLPGVRVVRVMPNLATVVGEGMSVFCAGSHATEEDRATARGLLSAFGRVLELPEEQFDAVTAVSGSGPAFFAYLLECLADAGASEGLGRADALRLALQTMLGTARLLTDRGTAPAELIKAVSSAKGTTAAGMAVLEASRVSADLRATIGAAARRSRELSA